MNLIKSTINLKRIKRYYVYHKYYLLFSILLSIVSFTIALIINLNNTTIIHPTELSYFNILSHNLIYGGVVILSGFLSFGIGSSILTLINFYSLGKIVVTVSNAYGFKIILTSILPHAIFELSAIILCCVIGYETLRIAKNIKSSAKGNSTTPIYIGDTILQILLIILLFSFAALIESTISFI